MTKIVTMDKVVLMIMPNGKSGGVGSGLEPISIDRHGMTGKTDATIPGLSQIFGRDEWGRSRVKLSYKEVPGGLNTGTVEYEKTASIDFLEKRARDEERFGIWEMYAPCARLDNPQGWLNGGRLDYRGKTFVTGLNEGDAPARDGSGEPVVNTVPVSWEYNISLLPLTLSNISPTSSNAEDLNGIAVLSEANPGNCLKGYEGPDQHIYLAPQAGATATATVLYSADGGSTWAATSTDPFGNDEHISDIVARITTETGFRVVVSRGATDAGNAAEIAYADVTFGAEGTTSWTTVDIGATNGDVITILEWLGYNRLYAVGGAVGSEGEIWVSTDQGESFTIALDGTTVINALAKGYGQDCKDVWAVGASNLIMRERNFSGTFETLVGPSGGGAFTAVAQANDGLLFAGNGQSLYVSDNEAANTGGWTSLKDFGSAHVVKKIFFPKGDSNHIYVVVDDTTPSGGEFWHSNDGGNTWNQVTELANVGYNDAYQSAEDANLFYICGDANATPLGQVHKVSPSESGC